MQSFKVNKLKYKGYHKLIIWQKARELVLLIYKYTENFPRSEEFGLKSQLRRVVVSVMLTIVEGQRRKSKKDFLHFLNIAMSSLTEVEAALEICKDLEFINQTAFEAVEAKRAELAVILEAFIKGLSKQV